MLIFIHATPHFYAGLMGGISRIKRTLTLDPDFKDLNPQTENSKNHFEGSLHVGFIKPIKEKYFMGIEGFVGRLFGEDYFKPQMNFGAKALAGFNLNDRLRLYAGAGVNFIRIKSLKIGLNNEVYNFAPIEPINYRMFPLFLGNIGVEFFMTKKLSIRVEGGMEIAGSKSFEKMKVKDFLNKGENTEPQIQLLENDSSERYHLFKATLGLFYHGGC